MIFWISDILRMNTDFRAPELRLFFEAHPPRLRTPKWSSSKLQEAPVVFLGQGWLQGGDVMVMLWKTIGKP